MEPQAKVLPALVIASILGGFAWVRDVDGRLLIIEDDLTEAIEVVRMLHPPRIAADSAPPVLLTAPSPKADKRRQMLQSLKEQARSPQTDGDDDDSARPPPLPDS